MYKNSTVDNLILICYSVIMKWWIHKMKEYNNFIMFICIFLIKILIKLIVIIPLGIILLISKSVDNEEFLMEKYI